MNAQELSEKRRAIYTGLKPFLPREDLLQALSHWEANYADRPRFTLQRFVADICRDDVLRGRRSDILLSLVQAMNMPVASLLPDPLHDKQLARADGPVSASTSAAFCALMEALMTRVPLQTRHSFRLDLLSSLSRRHLPPALLGAMQSWLGNDQPLKVPAAQETLLQSLVNRTYVVLCERLGPVAADKALVEAVRTVQAAHPDMDKALNGLL
ncbi:hypothetical protein A167_02205 [Alcanivorax sp. S71-1-4]|uniref:hypothetical protein n=1 Tax=Alcanivorax sp. S71-1-4 TaxID=1177159 RepID=UPI001357E335|nr:hypothetical protein [Alcanivorax sp. S71-1-4]KAF0808995.1 hypothetical protein A167_02205 [Alcanivorax sp. S71-1-4]